MASGICILGPVELRNDGHRETLGTSRESLTLAALAVDVGRPVSVEALIHRLWDDSPPAKPRNSVHAYATRLRKRLARHGDTAHLVQQSHSYTLDVIPDAVDLHFFQRLTADARTLADEGSADRALDVMHQASGLWRGEPLTGLPGLWAAGVRRNLAAKRLAAEVTRLGTELRLGRYAQSLPDLLTLVDHHPTDETLAGYLMVAEYGCRRQANALRTYDAVRHRLRTELGTAPGESLSRLYQLILNQAPAAELLAGAAGDSTAPHTLPAQGTLVGREEELACVLDAAGRGEAPRTGAVLVIYGGPGVGKSALAGAAARRLAPRFPDGQVHVELGGYTLGRPRLAPEAALSALLRTFGTPATSIPSDLPGLVSTWRTLLASRQAVIVLDDAADAAQIQPLLPGDSASVVLITSRHRLAGLPGAESLVLDELPMDSAVALFRRLAGEERTGNLQDIRSIVEICGFLPLALETTAGRLVSRPSWDTGHLISRLNREHGRLDEIRNGPVGIRATFAMSINTLPRPHRRAFRLLSLHSGRTFGSHAAAALTGLTLDTAERVLEGLLDAHLIREPEPERYGFHDLLKEYAKDLSTVEELAEDRDAAMSRMIVFYVRSCELADSLLYPRRPRQAPRELPGPAPAIPRWSDAEHARQWLLDEYEALTAVARETRASGDGHSAALLAHALAGFLEEQSLFADACALHAAGAAHWHRAGDGTAEGAALVHLSNAQTGAGLYDEARATGLRALATARSAHSRQTVTEALRSLAILRWNEGRHMEARSYQEEALILHRESGDVWQISRALNNMGIFNLYLGNYETAVANLEEALNGFRSAGDAKEVNRTFINLSNVYLETGDDETARSILESRLNYLLTQGNDSERAIARVNLADSMNTPSEQDAKMRLYRRGLEVFVKLDDKRDSSITLHRIGIALQKSGQPGEALTHQRRALDLARELGARLEECRALWGCGTAQTDLGNPVTAARNLDAAMAIAESLSATRDMARILESMAYLRARYGDADAARGLRARSREIYARLHDAPKRNSIEL